MKRRIIGCGNPDRGDDAAGVLAARRLRELGLDAVEHTGDGAALLEAWKDAAEVILVDAAVTGAAAGTIHVWHGKKAPVEAGTLRCSTHHFGVGEALRLAATLGRLPEKLTIYGIEGKAFGVGTEPSGEVAAAVKEVVRRIAEEVKRAG